MHIYVRRAAERLGTAVMELQQRLVDVAEQHVDTVMPGLTHPQPAQPVTLAFHLLAHFFMFDRDRERLQAVTFVGDPHRLMTTRLAMTKTWGKSVECGVLEDPWVEPPEEAFSWTVSPFREPHTGTGQLVLFHPV